MSAKKGFAAVASLRRRAEDRRGGQAKPPAFPPGSLASDALGPCAEAWMEALRTRNYSPGTIKERTTSLRAFIAWAAERDVTRAGEVTRPVLEAYQRWVWRLRVPDRNGAGSGEKALAWSTQRQRVACLQGLFRWLTRQNILLHNPASELELPRPEKRLPKAALSPEELGRLFAVPDIADPLGVRDRAMLELFYATGIRRAELCGLEPADVNPARGTLTVRHGKGNKDRVVPLGARAGAWLRRYLDEVRPRLALDPRTPAVFLSGYGEAFNPDVVTRMVAAWMKLAGLAGRGSCHLLRHTCATHMHEGGADIRFIQQLLGHEKLDTTAIYTHVAITQLLEVHARCHPGARLAADAPLSLPTTTQTATAANAASLEG
jgi:integrase/recombinase XerD